MSKFDQILLTILFVSSSFFVLREIEYRHTVNKSLSPLTIYIQGEVQKPQMLTLPAGSRRIHAFEHCGGLTSRADQSQLQPARLLIDGETISVSRISPPKQIRPVFHRERGERRSRLLRQTSSLASNRKPIAKAKPIPLKINMNSGTEEQWQALPGIGPVLAERITHARAQRPGGTFTTLEDLTAIRGINNKTMVRLAPYLELEGI